MTVTAVDNDVYVSRSKVFQGRIGSTSGVSVQHGTEPSLTITEDEDQPTVTLAFTASSISENGGSTTVTASLDAAAGSDLTLTVGVHPDTRTAAVAGDITQSGTTLTIAAGQTSSTGTVTVTAVDNDVYVSRSKVFQGRIGSTSGVSVQHGTEPSLTITEDEDQPTVTLAFTASSISENGGSTTVTASLDAAAGSDLTLTVGVHPDTRTAAVAGDIDSERNDADDQRRGRRAARAR